MLKFVYIKAYAGGGMNDMEVHTSLRHLVRSFRQDPVAVEYICHKCQLAFKLGQPYSVDLYLIIKKPLNHFSRNGKSKRTA